MRTPHSKASVMQAQRKQAHVGEFPFPIPIPISTQKIILYQMGLKTYKIGAKAIGKPSPQQWAQTCTANVTLILKHATR